MKRCKPRITGQMNSLADILMNTVNTLKMKFMKTKSDNDIIIMMIMMINK